MGKKLTYEYVKRFVESQGYSLISKRYINSTIKLEMICSKGHGYSVLWGNFSKRNSRCKTCANEKLSKDRRHSLENVKIFVESTGYTLLSNTYANSREKIELKCSSGHCYRSSFSNFKAGKRCPTCEIESRSERNRHSMDTVKSKLTNSGYVLLSKKYINARTKIKVRCPNDHVINITMGHFHGGKRCPKCVLPWKGEVKVEESLDKFNIKFTSQKKFKGCKDKRRLPFDFYIPSLKTCIEVQGRQHYEPVEFFGGDDAFKLRKKHDRIKRKFCKKNNIKLLEISYLDFGNIEDILSDYVL